MAKGAVIARILSEYSDKGTKAAIKDLAHAEKKFSDFGNKVGKAFAVAAAASAAFAIKLGVDSVRAAMAQQQQMAVLANTLHNVTGANDAAVESVDRYIKQSALRFNFQEHDLIPSLQSLVVATKNVAVAESLQHLAMDISTNKGKELGQVSLALAKAYLGNFNALKRMGVPLSESIIKSKNFTAAVKELNTAFGGSAAAAADTFAGKLGRIGIAFDMVKKTIGNAIIVALQPFLDKFISALPQIEKWLDTNSQKIAAFFITGISYGVAFAKMLYDTFTFVSNNIKVFAELGAVIAAIWIGAKTAAAVGAFIKTVESVIKVFKLLRTAALGAAFAEAIATGGASAAVGLAAATAAFILVNAGLNKFEKDAAKTGKSVGDLKFDFKGLSVSAADYLKGLKGINTATSAGNSLTAQQIKVLAELKKMGIVPTTSTDPIELEAARLNLLKQGTLEEKARIDAIIAATAAQLESNAAITRYADLLAALADNKISTEEISILASKWGISTVAVEEYIAKIYAANSTPGNDASIMALYQAWGLTKEEAAKYIDFARALADQKLSSAEIENLMAKWGLTRQQVTDYAKQVQDGTVFSNTFADPGKAAKSSWDDALTALNAYLAAVAGASGAGAGGAGSGNGAVVVPTFPDGASAEEIAKIAADAAAAAEAAAAAAAAALDSAQQVVDQITASADAASASASGAGSVFGTNLPQYIYDQNPALAAAVGATSSRTSDIANLGASSSMGSNGAGGSATTNVTVNVQGSVTSQSDLISAIRESLLNSQLSGKQITALALTL